MSALGAAPSSQRAVAHNLRQTEANVSRQLKVMRKAGLVNIAKNKKDGRQRDVTLTAEGRVKFEKAQTVLSGMENTFEKQVRHAL